MEKSYLIQLTQNLYRLTLLFPKKEPLRYKMREIADEVLANFLRITNQYEFTNKENINHYENTSSREGIVRDLELLDCFFEVAKNQNWVSPVELSRVQEEYNRIKAEIKKIAKQPSKEGQTSPATNFKEIWPGEAKLIGVRPRQVEIDPEIRPQDNINRGQPQPVTQANPKQTLNFRQEKILEILRDKEKVQVWQVKEIFPEISKRTLRRDFRFLLKQGIIERIGERNETFYRLPTNYKSKRITNKDRTMS